MKEINLIIRNSR